MRAVAGVALALALASPAGAVPSFECGKASGEIERLICADQELQWFDRQLARLNRLALDQSGADTASLRAGQEKFLTWRDRCAGQGGGCVRFQYEQRLAELAKLVNVFEAFAVYSRRPRGASFWIVRFGFDAALRIGSVGNDASICVLETDAAAVTGKGVVRWRAADGKACRIDIIPEGDDLRVQSGNCQQHCGRAIFDGLYKREY